jgi:hypothetical protein
MNKQIEDLKQQAMVKEWTHDCWGRSESFNVLDSEKFAELIVRECSELADALYTQHIPAGPVIRKHFGVGE